MEEKAHGQKIQSMFDRISPRYDLLNRIISLGQDLRWRRRGARLAGDVRNGAILDVCCGSGDFIRVFHDLYGDQILLAGVDFSEQMIGLARSRLRGLIGENLLLCRADALTLPFADGSFDAVTIGFGIRNIVDRLSALKECRRVLKVRGHLIMIEPARPGNYLVRAGFSFYLKYISPLIGGVLSGDRAAYRYLYDSSVAFPHPDEFLGLMAEAGFEDVKAIPQTLGTTMIYCGAKSAEAADVKT